MFDCLIVIFEVLFRQILWAAIPGRRSQEILMLRKELQVLRRMTARPRLTSWDKLFFVSLYRLNKRVTENIVTIKPSTVLSWHRKLAARKWTYKNRQQGRPSTDHDIVKLVVEMKKNNPRWGARKIKGELRKLGLSISKTTVLKILKGHGFDPKKREFEETWRSFLNSHAKRFFSCDFVTVETAFLSRLYVFAIMDVSTREILTTAVTRHPTAQWLETIFRNCLMKVEDLPKYLVSDRDGIYGYWLKDFLDECYDIRLYRTPPKCPNCNSHIERWNRTLREELLDLRIFFGERDLRGLVKDFSDYYNQKRTHQSLRFNSPVQIHGESATFCRKKISRKRLVGNLVVDYSLAG